jgi:uncharacterized membrane protein YfcA
MLLFMPIVFCLVACIYAMAGFGGGSTYIALLAVSGLPLGAVPLISLTCNLIVTSQGSYLLARKGHADKRILYPLLAGSVPMAFLGGAWRLPEATFIVILALALSLAGVSMSYQSFRNSGTNETITVPKRGVLLMAGLGLGLLAGITGIGGGIYLAPCMHLLRWAPVHTVAACTSLFIVCNSLAGLTGQLTKGLQLFQQVPLWLLLALPLAVLIGGRAGSFLLSEKLPQKRIRLITAGVILLVATRLWIKVLG